MEDDLQELKVELLEACLLLGGCTDQDARDGAVHLRKCTDNSTTFEQSGILGKEVEDDDDLSLVDTKRYTLFYYRTGVDNFETLICSIKRIDNFVNFYFVDPETGRMIYYSTIFYTDEYFTNISFQ